MITFANSLDPDQARQNIGPDLDLNCLTMMVFLKEFFEKVYFEKISKNHEKLPCRQRVDMIFRDQAGPEFKGEVTSPCRTIREK